MIKISEPEFKQLADYMKNNYGINLKTEKKYLVVGRLQNLLLEKQMKSFSEYFDYIIADKSGDAVTGLVDRITTNHTYFMREGDHFEYLKSTLLPYWLSSSANNRDLRLWSAGCSTGEEPYTLAMVIADFFGPNKTWDTRILATDISDQAITRARQGIYLNEQITALPSYWKKNYFTMIDNEKSTVIDTIKHEVIFSRFNLMSKHFPFKKKFHLIFCRNVMIYFDALTKIELINKFYEATEPGGYLFVGHSESLDRKASNYRYIMPAIYRKE